MFTFKVKGCLICIDEVNDSVAVSSHQVHLRKRAPVGTRASIPGHPKLHLKFAEVYDF